ncbi:hypothetical protein BCR44DRAFT_1498344 [Catenaria anguillulae PL171]|uniref:Uncharacterized protein n=1 Tax=Catenaria anguillulae PL171 TaxID=765915 RepID=A0A1Y2HQX5_9FUNG|nr:hypothetical protein BCR44DRAFT_1498344 [Catenaria anguillulae PL171]
MTKVHTPTRGIGAIAPVSAQSQSKAGARGVKPASVLPVEIVLGVVALTRPRPAIPATCNLIATAFRSADPTLIRSWHNNIIFYANTAEVDAAECHEQITASWGNPHIQQLQSRLSYFSSLACRP